MKRFIATTAASVLFYLGLAGAVLAEDVKIGVVDIPKLMEQAPQAQHASSVLEKRFAEREAKLSEEREAIRKLEEQLKRDGDVMAASKKTSLEKEIRDRTRDFKRSWDNFKEDLNIARNEELGKLQREVIKAIIEVSKSERYDLVVTENVIYASDRVDITDKVLARLKDLFQASQ